MHLAPQLGDLNPTKSSLPPTPIPTFLPFSSSSCKVGVRIVIIYLDPLPANSPALLLCLCHSRHSPATSKHDSWQTGTGWRISVLSWGLPGGISGQLHVSFMDPIGVLPELQALILLVDETYFFTVVLLALALRRQ